jgi:hypothetical protein
MTTRDLEWVECWACGGSGDDDVNWDDLCTYCGGNGEYLRDVPDGDDYDDDELCTPTQPAATGTAGGSDGEAE